MTDLSVLSYGGGTQSAALALMSATGQLPKLDAVIFADTQGELPETYEYAEYVETKLGEAGIPFYRVSAGSLEQALLSDTPTSHNPTPPAHVLNPPGSKSEKGRIGGYRCSYDYKRRVITRKVKELCGGRGEWKRSTVEQWLGFSTDEVGRCKDAQECRCGHNRIRPPKEKGGPPRGHRPGCDACGCEKFDPWQVNVWPLIKGFGLQYRRSDTIAWFAANGHPTPSRSACWFCPNSRNPRWSALKEEHPDLWERACTLDETIRDGGGFNARGNQPFAGKMFLHDSLIPLRDADLRTRHEIEVGKGQADLFDDAELGAACESGVCFT